MNTIDSCSSNLGHDWIHTGPHTRECAQFGCSALEEYINGVWKAKGRKLSSALSSCRHNFRMLHSHGRVCTNCGLEQQLSAGEDTWVTTVGGREEGRKDDSGKFMAAIPYEEFPHALRGVIEVATFGARKYSRSNWVNVPDKKQRYYDAFHRHLLAHHVGEIYDAESNLPHLHHALWNLMAYVEILEKENTQ